jgi:hypothetical protein
MLPPVFGLPAVGVGSRKGFLLGAIARNFAAPLRAVTNAGGRDLTGATDAVAGTFSLAGGSGGGGAAGGSAGAVGNSAAF